MSANRIALYLLRGDFWNSKRTVHLIMPDDLAQERYIRRYPTQISLLSRQDSWCGLVAGGLYREHVQDMTKPVCKNCVRCLSEHYRTPPS